MGKHNMKASMIKLICIACLACLLSMSCTEGAPMKESASADAVVPEAKESTTVYDPLDTNNDGEIDAQEAKEAKAAFYANLKAKGSPSANEKKQIEEEAVLEEEDFKPKAYLKQIPNTPLTWTNIVKNWKTCRDSHWCRSLMKTQQNKHSRCNFNNNKPISSSFLAQECGVGCCEKTTCDETSPECFAHFMSRFKNHLKENCYGRFRIWKWDKRGSACRKACCPPKKKKKVCKQVCKKVCKDEVAPAQLLSSTDAAPAEAHRTKESTTVYVDPLDTNGDGKIDAQEAKEAKAALRKLEGEGVSVCEREEAD